MQLVDSMKSNSILLVHNLDNIVSALIKNYYVKGSRSSYNSSNKGNNSYEDIQNVNTILHILAKDALPIT